MRVLTPQHLHQIEALLGRSLAPDEVGEFPELKGVSQSVITVARHLATTNRMLASKYLLECAPDTRLSVVTQFLELVVEGGMGPEQWASLHGSAAK